MKQKKHKKREMTKIPPLHLAPAPKPAHPTPQAQAPPQEPNRWAQGKAGERPWTWAPQWQNSGPGPWVGTVGAKPEKSEEGKRKENLGVFPNQVCKYHDSCRFEDCKRWHPGQPEPYRRARAMVRERARVLPKAQEGDPTPQPQHLQAPSPSHSRPLLSFCRGVQVKSGRVGPAWANCHPPLRQVLSPSPLHLV